ncbi:MAG: hypothetical protein ACLFNU_07305 [Bacteroidales bacterium]
MQKCCKIGINTLFLLVQLTLLTSLAQGQAVQVDAMGAIWHLDGNDINKIDHDGNLLESYNNLLLGNPTSIDVSDPFKILVFYRESQNILLINNDANTIGKPVNLSDFGLGEITHACRSNRGGVWLYHRVSAELVRLDQRFTSIVQRIPFSTSEHNLHPNHLAQHNGVLYAGINNNIVIRMDEYGTILPQFQISYKNDFRIQNDKLWATHKSQTVGYNLKKTEENPEHYHCSCQELAVIIDNKPMCFDGEKLRLCKKINPLP